MTMNTSSQKPISSNILEQAGLARRLSNLNDKSADDQPDRNNWVKAAYEHTEGTTTLSVTPQL